MASAQTLPKTSFCKTQMGVFAQQVKSKIAPTAGGQLYPRKKSSVGFVLLQGNAT
jgi:hypothetical protein